MLCGADVEYHVQLSYPVHTSVEVLNTTPLPPLMQTSPATPAMRYARLVETDGGNIPSLVGTACRSRDIPAG